MEEKEDSLPQEAPLGKPLKGLKATPVPTPISLAYVSLYGVYSDGNGVRVTLAEGRCYLDFEGDVKGNGSVNFPDGMAKVLLDILGKLVDS